MTRFFYRYAISRSGKNFYARCVAIHGINVKDEADHMLPRLNERAFSMDKVPPEKRSLIMAQVRGRDTRPEKIVRSVLHRMGYRFRLHRKDLPGSPDIVLPKFHTAIFVNGCFWHRHPGCKRASTPVANASYWQKKFERNVERDKQSQTALKCRGWHVLVIWECELKDLMALQERISRFFSTILPNSPKNVV